MKMFGTLKIAKDIGGKAPDSFKIFNFGMVEIENSKPVILDAESAKEILKHFNSYNHEMVIDYEHQTLGSGKAPAAGWCSELFVEDNGLYAKVKWTDEAKGYLSTGEYKYFSPVFFYDKKTRKITKLYNLALTNQPRMKDIQVLAAKLSVTQKQEGQIMLKKLRELFKLKEDVTEDEAINACKEMQAKNVTADAALEANKAELAIEKKNNKKEVVACEDVMNALKLSADSSKEKVCDVISSLSAPATAAQELSLQVAKLTTQISEMKRDDLVAIALKSGKTSPEEIKTWGKDLAEKSPEQFEKIVLSRPEGSVIPLKNLGTKTDDGGKTHADDAQISINKALGIDAEEFKKYNKE